MLILTRRPGQTFTIAPDPSLGSAIPIRTLFAQGPIEVMVTEINGKQVKLGIRAHPGLTILRAELCVRPGLVFASK